MDRKALEEDAMGEVCDTDLFYLYRDLYTVDDDTLRKIVDNGCYIHESEGYDCVGEVL